VKSLALSSSLSSSIVVTPSLTEALADKDFFLPPLPLCDAVKHVPGVPPSPTPSRASISPEFPVHDWLLELRLKYHTIVLPPDAVDARIYEKVERVINTALAYGRLSPLVSVPQLDRIVATVIEACESVNYVFGVSHAVEAANGFVMPEAVFTRDLDQLREHDFSLSRLIYSRQSALLDSRLNHARLDLWDQSDPDLPLLRQLVDGINIPLDPNFVPDRSTPPFSPMHTAASVAINLGWWKLYEQGLCLLIPTQPLIDSVPEEELLSKSPSGWTPKFQSKGGRITSGYHYDNKRGGQINTPYVRAAMEALFGPIKPPEIDGIMKKILTEAERVGWDNLILWKMDIKGAFNLLFFRHDQAGVMSHDLMCGLTLINIVGNFGWCGLPYAFFVVTRSILRAVQARVTGVVDMFVDDLMGCCPHPDLQSNLAIAKEIIESLLGPGTVANQKTIFGRQLDFIGWHVDLDTQLLGVSRHNFSKALYSFLEIVPGDHLTIEEMEGLASRASRYSLVSRYMKPFSQVLYHAYSGRSNRFATIPIVKGSNLWEVIRLWQLFFVLMDFEPMKYTRHLVTFAPSPTPRAALNLDACLTGIGLLVWVRPPHVSWTLASGEHPPINDLAAIIGHDTPYRLHGDSSYQNAMEFIVIVFGIAVLVSLGHQDISFILQGDSKSALSWSFNERFRSQNCMGATLAFIQLSMVAKIDINEGLHILGELQVSSDPLSRSVDPIAVCRINGLPRERIRYVKNNPALERLLTLMDPSEVFSLSTDLPDRWKAFDSLIMVLMSPSGGWR
jgi:hypothetical protein